jgi:hypothetical protein
VGGVKMGVKEWNADTWAAVLGAAVVVLGALGAAFRWLMQDRHEKAYERGWDRVGELEEEVKLLRIALHRATQRGNVGLVVSEILSLAMPLPLEDRIRAAKQARQIVEHSLNGGQQ